MLSYIIIAIVALIVAFLIYMIIFQQFNIGKLILKSEEIKGESQLKEKISIIYYGIDGIILANDGEEAIKINKIYVDNEVFAINEILNPNEKKQFFIPLGENLMLETSSGNLFKFERSKPTLTKTSGTHSPEITEITSSVISSSSSIYLKTTYTSTITTTIPIQTYSYKTITTITTTTTTTTYWTTTVYSWPYPYETTEIIKVTITSTFTYKYTLTIASSYTSYKTTTYTTEIDPIIEIKENNLDNIVIGLIIVASLLIIFYYNLKKVFL